MAQLPKGDQPRNWSAGGSPVDVNELFKKSMKNLYSLNGQFGGTPTNPSAPASFNYTPGTISAPGQFTNPLKAWTPQTVNPEAAIKSLEPVYQQRKQVAQAEVGQAAGFTGTKMSSEYMKRSTERAQQLTNEWQMQHEGMLYDASKFNREQELQKMLAQANLDYQSWAKHGDWTMESGMFNETMKYNAAAKSAELGMQKYGLDIQKYGMDTSAKISGLGIGAGLVGQQLGANQDQFNMTMQIMQALGMNPNEASRVASGIAQGGSIPGNINTPRGGGGGGTPGPTPSPNPNPSPRPPRPPGPSPIPSPTPGPFPPMPPGPTLIGNANPGGSRPGGVTTMGTTGQKKSSSRSSRYAGGRNPNTNLLRNILGGGYMT